MQTQQNFLVRHIHSRLGKIVACSLAALLAHSSVVANANSSSDQQSIQELLRAYAPVTVTGQSATQLPDGRWLLLGGVGQDAVATTMAVIVDPLTKQSRPLSAKLLQARSGHSATLLPDGTVLILGGSDADGNVVMSAEQFDPATSRFSMVSDLGLIARSGHTATVLSDGILLITGGADARGRALYEAELYNPFTHAAERFNAKLDTARLNHLAALLPSANVLLWGGSDPSQQALNNGELYDPGSQRFSAISADAAAELTHTLVGNGQPSIKDSQPAADDSAAPIDQALVVRFNQRMAVASLNSTNVTLIGPHGAVPIKLVAVENGLLLFITPQQDLLPASRYTLFMKDATDVAGQTLSFAAIGFTTAQLSGQSVNNGQTPATNYYGNGNAAAAGAQQSASQAGFNTKDSTDASHAGQHDQVPQKAHAAAEDGKDAEEWYPDARHFNGDWRAKRAKSQLQSLPPLQAPPGETALAGQVLTLHGQALAHVTLSIANQSTETDNTGRFLLTNLTAGTHVLAIDGQSANREHAKYGYYQAQVTITGHRTNVLNYTIWDSKLDPAGTINLRSPTTQDTVVTSPRIPGLELRIPAGTVIRDRNGKIVTQINMTAIPTDRPPFPIPDVGVPTYFTIQPGGATLTNTSGRAQQGAQLVYPNFSGSAPGTRIDFWNYDARGKGWYVYGQGTVTPDGRQVMPDKGVAIYEFTGAMISQPSNAPPEGPPCDGCKAGDPVDIFTGLFLNEETDLAIDDIMPLEVRRSYRPRDSASRAFGIGTNMSYDLFLVGDVFPYTYQDLILPDGGRIHYVRISAGTSFEDAVYRHTATAGKYFGSTLSYRGGNCAWELKLKDGAATCFPDSFKSASARAAAATSMSDRYGNTLTLTRASNGNLTQATSPSGRYIQFVYDASNRVTSATDNIGRTFTYAYDAAGHLIQVIDPTGQSESYTYDASHNMLTVQDKRGNLMVTNTYDTNNRVATQTYADSTSSKFVYTLDANGKVTQTDVTDERNVVTRTVFNANGYPNSIISALGLPEQQTVSFVYDAATNLVQSRTDALGRQTTYSYDANGNLLTTTLLAGTANAVMSTMSYTADFNKVASVTDVLQHKTVLNYDAQGNLIQVTDPNSNSVTYSYNNAGQVTQVTDPRGKVTTFAYDGYDLSQVTDPLNRTVNRFTDAVGRLSSSSDAEGNRTTYDHDALDQTTTVTDALSQPTSTGYDANGNATQLTNAKGGLHQFAFDKRNEIIGSSDPLNLAETYVYDNKHNLIQKTDRKNQVTQYAYDALNRLTKISYADNSTVSYTYDQGNRITQIVDSVNGTIGYTYDALDRVTSTSTAKGTVTYTYYANGLRQSMTVNGQPTLTYNYDNGNRLTNIDQAAGAANNNVAQHISFSYDAANRRTQTTLTNGISVNYGYDDANQLTAIVYKKADGSTLGDLSYGYDAAGQRISIGGSLATANLPNEMSGVSIDAANRLTAFGTQTLTYDANGNLTGDGTQTYVWNARNQLTHIKDITGAPIASFSYDALGRRQTKTVSGISTGYVYDGMNIMQELNGINVDNSLSANVRANYISGGLDEVFAQLSGTGTGAAVSSYLIDALGSTIQMTDASGNKVAGYTYDPYGNTTADMVVNNPFQYTGRENDGTGLYYYRARYYSPGMGRFISSDPIGLGGGINTYAYVNGNPISFYDPYGLWAWGDSIDQRIVDAAAGFGDTISMGGTALIRNLADIGSVNRCSSAYMGGTAAGAVWGLAWGGATAGRYAANVGARTFFSDARQYSTVQRIWSSSVGGYKGSYELHHWFTPQSLGGTSAGWNLVAVSRGLNRAMSNGGFLFNAFKGAMIGSHLGALGAVPTAIANSNRCECQ